MARWEILQESIGTGLADAGLTRTGGTHVGGGHPASRRPRAARSVPAARPLGEGGQGVVFLGEDERGTHGRVAVKLLNGGFGPETEARSRFLRELETAKRVAEFCTAAILDADVAGDRPYIVSELVDGPSLHRVVTAEGPRARGALERLAVGTATALVAIHRAGVVHRDFKPHNVLLGPDGPRVIDFGIARALDTGTITSGGAIGTPAYMAPEQLEGLRAGPAADVFAWAGTMVFASSGRLPFAADTMTAMVGRVMHGEPDLGELTGPLRDVAARCLAKDPAARPTASEVLRALLGDADRAPAPPAPAGTRTMQAPPAPPAPYAHPAPPGPPAPGTGGRSPAWSRCRRPWSRWRPPSW
ncbi:serine/threonine-protein kinase [Actinomadura madurae]|uniref:serine/threonine-protein kinase n=1 Tax=Actinomadura madurae TaxID=1993 RepID=UPI0026E5472B|nr:serine/threonine-protein kinase [Actinomadura madurae]